MKHLFFQDSRGVTVVLTLLDELATMLAVDLENDAKNRVNATLQIKEDNVGKHVTHT